MTWESLWRWRVALMAAGVTALAALMRFVGLGQPTSLVFDEVFYARGAYSLLTLGFEGSWDGDNQDFAAGDFSGLSSDGDYVVHPMVGKLLIAGGIQLFGPTPFGWRFMGALLGVATVVMVAFIARQLFRSTLWGGVAGLLLAVEGTHVVLSRSALLDVFLTFFVVAGFGLLVVDRAVVGRRLRALAVRERESSGTDAVAPLPGLGPALGVRWWRLAAIVAFGLAVSVKWSGLWFAAFLLVLSVLWDLADRRAAGYERWIAGTAVRTVPAVLLTIIGMLAVYVASWTPWFLSPHGYGRQWAVQNPDAGVQWLPEALRSLWRYHEQMWTFHQGLDSEHTYSSSPWGWPMQIRPTAFHFQDAPDAVCGAERCVSAITSVGNPLLWWAGAAVLIYAVYRVLWRRDLMALTVMSGFLAGWLPWLPLTERTMFTFYTVVMSPFLVLMVVWALRRIAQPEALGYRYARTELAAVFAFVALVLVVAGFFVPLWTGQPIPYEYWRLHMWLPSWV